MTRKHFDKDLYNKYDTLAKEQALKIFKGTTWTLEYNEKKTDVDFKIMEGDEHIGYLEVEVKMNWDTVAFPYGDVQWPERKWKYCQLDKPTIFMMFNHDLGCYLTAPGSILLGSKLEMIRNKYVKFGENFFKVPVTNVRFNDVHGEVRSL